MAKKKITFPKPSAAALAVLEAEGVTKKQFVGKIPICSPLVCKHDGWTKQVKESFGAKGAGPVLDCPTDRTGMQKYVVVCSRCGEKLAYFWSKGNPQYDYCNLHYLTWYDRKGKYGCATVHVSPIDHALCFECMCGQDTRDFRANTTLPKDEAERIERQNSRGRKFGLKSSKFRLVKVKEV